MRSRVTLAVFTAGISLFGIDARAAGPWYLSANAGGYFREDTTASATIGNGTGAFAPGTVVRTFDPGFVVNLAGGYRWPFRLRTEIELGYAQNSEHSVTPTVAAFPNLNGVTFSHPTGSNLHRAMATLNAFYDLPIEGRFVPYVGGGLGAIRDQAATVTAVSAAGGRFVSHLPSGYDGMALIEGGLTIAVTEAIAVVPAYRYIREFGSIANSGQEVAHVVKVGLRYTF